jgi:hypothetical protein
VRQALRIFATLSRPMRLGIVVLLFGAGLDLVYHVPAIVGQDTIDGYLGENGFLAHLVTFIGMAVTLFGVVAAGLVQATRRGLSGRLTTSSRHTLSRGKES